MAGMRNVVRAGLTVGWLALLAPAGARRRARTTW